MWKNKQMKIYCSSKDLRTIQMATPSKKYNLIHLSKNIKKLIQQKTLREVNKELNLYNLSNYNNMTYGLKY